MSQKTDTDLHVEADIIMKEQGIEQNTQVRIGKMLKNIIDSKQNRIDAPTGSGDAFPVVTTIDEMLARTAAELTPEKNGWRQPILGTVNKTFLLNRDSTAEVDGETVYTAAVGRWILQSGGETQIAVTPISGIHLRIPVPSLTQDTFDLQTAEKLNGYTGPIPKFTESVIHTLSIDEEVQTPNQHFTTEGDYTLILNLDDGPLEFENPSDQFIYIILLDEGEDPIMIVQTGTLYLDGDYGGERKRVNFGFIEKIQVLQAPTKFNVSGISYKINNGATIAETDITALNAAIQATSAPYQLAIFVTSSTLGNLILPYKYPSAE